MISAKNFHLTALLLLFAVCSAIRQELCSSPALAIPPSGGGASRDEIEISLLPGDKVKNVEVKVNLDHTYLADLVIDVSHSESGLSTRLFDRECDDTDDLHVVYSDKAFEEQINCALRDEGQRFQPYMPLAVFDGLQFDSNTWVLSVNDRATGDEGTLDSWCISFDVVHPKYVALPTIASDFRDARDWCRDQLGSDLAIIRSKDDNTQASAICAAQCDTDASCSGCVIGLQDKTREGLFLWIDDSRLSFDFWADGQPNNNNINDGNEDCAELRKEFNYEWNDFQCNRAGKIALCHNPILSPRSKLYPNSYYHLNC